MDTKWPIEDEAFQKVLCFHMLEHIPIEKTLHVFQEVYRVLSPGGVFIAETPNIIGLCQDYLKGNVGALRHIYSAQRAPGDGHVWGHTAESLATLAYATGFFMLYTSPGTDYHAEQMNTVRLEAVKGG